MVPRALTIAGSDSGGGAGVQADLKTFTVLGVYGMSAITSVTVQNTLGVYGVVDMPPHIVYDQIRVVVEDIGVDACKTGMLSNEGIIMAVAKAIREFRLEKFVLDPVMVAKSGDPLLKESAREALFKELLPLAMLVTPNIPEAQEMCGFEIKTLEDMEKACKVIYSYGCSAVIVKGGHREDKDMIDVLYDGQSFEYLRGKYVKTKNTHGTGCTFSSAITAYLAKGYSLKESAKMAKEYLQKAIEHSLPLGKGHGPLNHMWSIL
ncbi:MAG: bifunctional hydroxymethylpyrimidine kinase/phosphomethylpyrimidine kinase [Aquificaceae bacterium]|nr:bifunctional hydroxymethylpyrimidine kinase/phosphomethylpyrimidine kinase [Aquificaceae bacterium]MCS7277547.1 bifunctional hydroxymethylpyrimidine kinase/phosphomethylpyrimidine kinase [Aquificaceae bacterium]MDW8066057.1 bifunctional hydroxymethylpyrimidine kinase/phosphomethylpyrimidine kinase [Aquificaceae bacterium]MDW8423074.1 bifunctional hydroxymethylpyrimidine kinase/phosphomethylpyrimidine kinase [Aquificaceae bacterium]